VWGEFPKSVWGILGGGRTVEDLLRKIASLTATEDKEQTRSKQLFVHSMKDRLEGRERGEEEK